MRSRKNKRVSAIKSGWSLLFQSDPRCCVSTREIFNDSMEYIMDIYVIPYFSIKTLLTNQFLIYSMLGSLSDSFSYFHFSPFCRNYIFNVQKTFEIQPVLSLIHHTSRDKLFISPKSAKSQTQFPNLHMLIVQRPERYAASFVKCSLCFFLLNAFSVPLLLDPEV